ncbi:MAG: HNH endonuclease [Candidatus Diapherotrites archaeon]
MVIIERYDKGGYPRGKLNHSDLIHRQIAYSEIYLKDRKKYPLPFGKYVIHHKDRNKKNFNPDNLQLLTREEHDRIHKR